MEEAPGNPHTGSAVIELLTSSGLQIVALTNEPAWLGSICAPNLNGGPEDPRTKFARGTFAAGDDEHSAVIEIIVFATGEERALDWAIGRNGDATVLEDGACAMQLASSSTVVLRGNPVSDQFFSSGLEKHSVIGHGNILVAFTNAVFGGNPLGGDGVDPEVRTEVERIIRALHEE